MAAARYWRIVGVETYAGGDLDLSALHLYAGSTRVDSTATITSSHAPMAGTLAALQDEDTATVCRFSGSAVRSGGFALVWDFGVGNVAEITAIQPGGGDERACFIASCLLQSSADTITWAGAVSFGRFPWPGANAMTAAPVSGGDPLYDKVSLLLHLDGANGSTIFTDSSSFSHVVTGLGGAKISTAYSLLGGASGDFSAAGRYLDIAPSSQFSFPGDFTLEWGSLRLSTTADGIVMHTTNNASATDGWWVNFSGDSLVVYNKSSLIISVPSAGTAGGVYKRWAISRIGSELLVFRDGEIIGSVTTTADFSNGNRLQIGGHYSFGGFSPWLMGFLDEIRITKDAGRTPSAEPFPDSAGVSGGIVFSRPLLRTSDSRSAIAAASSGISHSTCTAFGLQLARDVEFGGPGAIYGTTKTKGAPNLPTKARVVLQHQRSKLPVRETWSDPVTGAFVFAGIDSSQQFLALAEDAEGHFRPVAANRLTPEVL